MQINVLRKPYEEKRLDSPVATATRYDIDLLLAFGLLGLSSAFLCLIVRYLVPVSDNVIDDYAFLFFKTHGSEQLIMAARICTFFGTGAFLIPAYLVTVIFLVKNNYRESAYLVLSAAISATVLGWVLKIIFHRSRPLNHLVSGAGGFSFPSGHALGGFIFTGVFLCLIWKSNQRLYMKWPATILICLFGFAVGVSRICLHVHYATDVLGSLLIAITWLCLLYILFRLYFPKSDSTQNTRLLYYH